MATHPSILTVVDVTQLQKTNHWLTEQVATAHLSLCAIREGDNIEDRYSARSSLVATHPSILTVVDVTQLQKTNHWLTEQVATAHLSLCAIREGDNIEDR